MQLGYLLFDATDEENGSCSFDAMASVAAERIQPLLRELEAVLDWAYRGFGPPSAEDGASQWDFAVSASDEQDAPVDLRHDPAASRIGLSRVPDRLTLTLTVAGSQAFAQAFRETFTESD